MVFTEPQHSAARDHVAPGRHPTPGTNVGGGRHGGGYGDSHGEPRPCPTPHSALPPIRPRGGAPPTFRGGGRRRPFRPCDARCAKAALKGAPMASGRPASVPLGPEARHRGNWCCRRDSNSRPLPYQGSALPLSYGSADPRNPYPRPSPGSRQLPRCPRAAQPRPAGGRRRRGGAPGRQGGSPARSLIQVRRGRARHFCRSPRPDGVRALDGRRGVPYCVGMGRGAGTGGPGDGGGPAKRPDRLKASLRANLRKRKARRPAPAAPPGADDTAPERDPGQPGADEAGRPDGGPGDGRNGGR